MTEIEKQAITQLYGPETLQKIEAYASELLIIRASMKISFEEIAMIVADNEGITIEAMKGKTRKSEVVQARQLVYNLATEFLHGENAITKTDMGWFFNQDHSTVVHARKVLHQFYPEFQRKYKLYAKKISEHEKRKRTNAVGERTKHAIRDSESNGRGYSADTRQ